MIEAAEREGRIEPGRTTIVEATSGNTGIALAFVCAAKGYDLMLYLPQGMSREREGLLRLYGARVEVIESLGGMNEAVEAARRMRRRATTSFLPDQFSNPANPEIHRRTTGPEILEALDGRVDVLVAGVGTGGTITGVGRVPQGAATRDCGSSRSSPPRRPCCRAGRRGRTRSRASARASCPPCSTATSSTRSSPSATRTAIDTARLLARARGRARRDLVRRGACGPRSRSRARPDAQGQRIVVVLPDSGERYVSTPFFAP